jgi:hypothetical protein
VKTIIRFRGGVSCRWDDAPPVLTVVGRSDDRPDEIASVTFVGAAHTGLPEALENAIVEQVGAASYLIRSDGRDWQVGARSVHLHREIADAFYSVIAPRPVPWVKRVFWRAVLGLVSFPIGKRLLLALRR